MRRVLENVSTTGKNIGFLCYNFLRQILHKNENQSKLIIVWL